MRILYLDLDSLRPDHLGCYGYHRDTSPNIDRVAAEGVRFTGCHASDVPCCPSRTALMSGLFGYHSGVVGHGGTAADFRLEGPTRTFRNRRGQESLPAVLRAHGYHTASISSFTERHGAWWFHAGFTETLDTGGFGLESAEEVTPSALDWIARRGAADNWFLHLNYWDPHMPSRAPVDFGNPFADEPLPDWLTEEKIAAMGELDGFMQLPQKQWAYARYRHGFRHILGVDVPPNPRCPTELKSLDDIRAVIDGYDCGVRYLDSHLGQIFTALKNLGVWDDTAVIISADHGENLCELGISGDHITADAITCRVPLLLRWPGGLQGRVDDGLHYALDLAPTLAELTGAQASSAWDGASFANAIVADGSLGRDHLILSTGAGTCQRAARFDNWLYIRTLHDGYNLFPDEMLFNLVADPHEEHDLATERPEELARGRALLEAWEAQMQETMPSGQNEDPLQIVIREGGPSHVRGGLPKYLEQLAARGRHAACAELRCRHPDELTPNS